MYQKDRIAMQGMTMISGTCVVEVFSVAEMVLQEIILVICAAALQSSTLLLVVVQGNDGFSFCGEDEGEVANSYATNFVQCPCFDDNNTSDFFFFLRTRIRWMKK